MDELKSSQSIQGYTQFPNFEMLDARIASAGDKRLPLDTLNLSEPQGNVFGRNPSRGTHHGVAHKTQGETGSAPQAIETGTSFARDEERMKCTIPMPTFARRPPTMNSFLPYSKVCKSRNCNSTSSLHVPHFYVGRHDSKTKGLLVLIFPRRQCYGSKKWSWLIQWFDLMSSCSVRGIRMPDFEVLDAKIASALNRIIQNSFFKKKVSLEEQKAQKEDRFLRGRRIAYMIYDSFRVTGAHDTVLDYAVCSLSLFVTIMFRNSIQDGMKFYYLYQRSHPMTFWKVCTN